MHRAVGLAIAVSLISIVAQPAWAIWAPVPLEMLVDEADLIVQGKVVRTADAGFKIGARPFDAAVVEVTAVLKNITGQKEVKQVPIAQPAAGGGLALSTDIRFNVGQEGIWILTKDRKHNAYWASHPFQFQQSSEKDKLVELIAARKKIAGGKEADGLVARAELIEHPPPAVRSGMPKPPTYYEVRLSLQNVSDKPIVICDYAANKPLSIFWTGPAPNALPRKSQHYSYLATAAFMPPLGENSFLTIPPGGVAYVGPRGKYYGISFSTAESNNANLVETGKHKITVAYANRQDGKALGFNEVWSGDVVSNVVEIDVK